MQQAAKPSVAQHRSEIDGLRSVAVLSVVLYHFGFTALRGGFVGVDIFFVISGFLIGGILWREHTSNGTLSLGRFYMRRIRRLAPAYFAMAFASLIAGWFILLPFEFREFGKSLIAATVYLSNVLFYRQAGYFDGPSDEKLLLHTWSLSVEEQFYIFLPLTILVLARSRNTLIVGLGFLAVASLVSSVVMTEKSHTAAFYLFPFRAWELLAGVLLAIAGVQWSLRWAYGAWLSWLGMALIVASVLFIPGGTSFPGWHVIAPVVGTVLILVNGQDRNWVNRALSAKVPVFFGLISYSLYLWHWPILTLLKYVHIGPLGIVETLFWLSIVFVVSIVSWRFVERPVRNPNVLASQTVLGGTLVASLVLLLSGAMVFKGDGFEKRFSNETQIHIRASADFLQDWSRCKIDNDGPLAGLEVCPIGPEGQTPEVLIWGDSHVRAFREGLAQAANLNNRAGLIIWHAGCPPVFNIEKHENTATVLQDQACRISNDQIMAAIVQMPELRDLLLVGRWSYYASGTGTGLDGVNKISLTDVGEPVTPNPDMQLDLLTQKFGETVQFASEHFDRVFVLLQPPEIALYDSRQIAKSLAHGQLQPEQNDRVVRISRKSAEARAGVYLPLIDAVDDIANIEVLDTWPYFCSAESCSAIADGVGQYFDNNHVTNSAARRLVPLFNRVFQTSEGGASK
jgi:peptidoglycan/LPS O-acetylase OafA/YrhL